MRAVLVNPPSQNTIVANLPGFVDEERGHNPPLGLLYVATMANTSERHEVSVIDCQAEHTGYDELGTRLARHRPDVVGITAMSFTMIDVLKTVRVIRQAVPSAKIVLGGPHPHIYPRETLALDGIDAVVVGEGERSFQEVLDSEFDPQALAAIPGIWFKDGSNLRNTSPRPPEENLDALPTPDRTLLPVENYDSLLSKRNPTTTMFTSRGCPYRCVFCDRPHLGKVFRARSADSVAAEFVEMQRLGIREVIVYDDTFTIDRRRVLELCDHLASLDMDLVWDIRARVNTVDEQMLAELKRAKCERIHFGIEAGTERILRVLRKGITLAQARDAMKLARRAGISTLAYFMIGCPTETREEALETVRFALELRPDFAHFAVFTLYPATEAYQRAKQEGIVEGDPWGRFAENPVADFRAPLWEEHMSRQELSDLLKLAYKAFYQRPRYIIRELTRTRSISAALRKVVAGLRVVRM